MKEDATQRIVQIAALEVEVGAWSMGRGGVLGG